MKKSARGPVRCTEPWSQLQQADPGQQRLWLSNSAGGLALLRRPVLIQRRDGEFRRMDQSGEVEDRKVKRRHCQKRTAETNCEEKGKGEGWIRKSK